MGDVLKDAILNGLYDSTYQAHNLATPQLITNNKDDNIWFNLRRELLRCESFTWTVAFISEDMLVPFKLVMEDLARKNIKGTLITGSYLNFNSPKVFKELMKIPNLELKISQEAGFHVKGYLFNKKDEQVAIIGSANFTRSALLRNYEWTLKFTSKNGASLPQNINQQIKHLKENSQLVTREWLDEYAQTWQKPSAPHLSKKIQPKIIPNLMQQGALKQLQTLVDQKKQKGLVVSATGTGKTYLGAFAVKDFKPKKFLYVVHRQQIAKKALESFYKVIGGNKKDYGLLSGNKQELDKKYIFATIQTLSQDKVLDQLKKNNFDYILIDEAHRSAAPSYQKILNYFEPKFWLGMTATPERMDNADVYQIFDYNLAYEIRLKDALEDKMLTPFHYVGVQDYVQNGETIDETTNLRYLASQKRVDYVLKELDYYGYSGKQAKGLVFCSRQEEARKLAELFTQKNHPSVALTNEDSEKRRQQVVRQLEEGKLDYIFTVDLFNEGIDIPSLNQIVMLRNTQSSIVFIQQLGRGLRKYPGKEFVTVVDFIGNYKNNYLIPLALNNDTSRLRENAVREVKIPQLIGISTINFSQVASDKILHSIENIKLDSMRQLRQSYNELKQKLGRPVLLYDFYKYGSTSPEVFIRNNSFKNYGDFLIKMGETVNLTSYENQVLTFVTKELSAGKRIHELLLLKLLLNNERVAIDDYISDLKKHRAYVNEAVLNSVDNILNLDFFNVKTSKTTKKADYGSLPIVKKSLVDYTFNQKILQALNNADFKKLLIDAIKTGLALGKSYEENKQFTLYKRYDRKDACRLLNWPLDVSAPMYGYRVGEKETPIFITYKKDSDKKRNSIYDNTFEDGKSLRWYTRTPRHLDSEEVKRLLDPKMKIHMFVKRSDSDGKGYFYLGQAHVDQDTVKQEEVGPKKKAAVGMNLVLDKPLANIMREILFE